MGIVYDPAYRGPIDAGDLGKCVSIFHVLAIVFAGTHTATEINAGSTALSFLTQKSRWASLAAQAAVQWAFLAFAYVRSEEHTSELQSRGHLVCRLLLEKKKRIEKWTYKALKHKQERG